MGEGHNHSFDARFVDDVSKMLKDHKRLFELGDYRQVILAIRTCAWHGIALPDWVAEEADAALLFYFQRGGAPGKGKSGGNLKQFTRSQIDRRRHQVADWELARRQIVGGNREQAFERASERLRGTPAQGSADAIEKSFNRVQGKLRQ